MKTKALLLAAILFATGSSICFAANDSNNNSKQKKECCRTKDGNKRECKAFNPFEGITLTADQQAKLEALKPQKCDKANGNQQCDKKINECPATSDMKNNRRQDKRDYLAKVKAILTPEQYVTYLENIAASAPGKAKHKDGMRKNDNRNRRNANKAPKTGSNTKS